MQENSPFKKYDRVITADGVKLGELLRIHHRLDDVNPDLRLYASYLEVWSLDFAGHFYIPADYIDDYDADGGTIYLTDTMRTVQTETWDRTPSFIAGRKSQRQELPTAVL
ncbi:MAG: hypothetical protein IPM53_10475 [Anaerolineaceae bacterium]|nr:hypothetical protein [Anaerolineaceae bacterium]